MSNGNANLTTPTEERVKLLTVLLVLINIPESGDALINDDTEMHTLAWQLHDLQLIRLTHNGSKLRVRATQQGWSLASRVLELSHSYF